MWRSLLPNMISSFAQNYHFLNRSNFQNLNSKTPLKSTGKKLLQFLCNIVMACCRLFDMWSYTQVCVYRVAISTIHKNINWMQYYWEIKKTSIHNWYTYYNVYDTISFKPNHAVFVLVFWKAERNANHTETISNLISSPSIYITILHIHLYETDSSHILAMHD